MNFLMDDVLVSEHMNFIPLMFIYVCKILIYTFSSYCLFLISLFYYHMTYATNKAQSNHFRPGLQSCPRMV